MTKRGSGKGAGGAGMDERRARGPGKRVGGGAGAPVGARGGKPGAKPKKAAPWLPDVLVTAPVRGERAGGGKSRGIAPSGAPPKRRGSRYADPQGERELLRYENPILSREGIIQFLSESAELMTVERIAIKLGYRDEERLDALTRRLTAMVRDGQLLVNRRGGYSHSGDWYFPGW